MKRFSTIRNFAGSVLTLMTATALVATSCDKNSFEDDSQLAAGSAQSEITLNVGMGAANDSRVSVTEGTSGSAWVVEWQKNDMLGGWSDSATAFNKFTMGAMTIAADNKCHEAAFSGTISGGQLHLVYPYDGTANAINEGKYTVNLSSQTVEAESDFAHLSDKVYMVSDLYTDLTNGTPASKADVKMHHLTALLQLQLNVSNLPSTETNYRIIRIELGGGTNKTNINTSETIDLSKPMSDADFVSSTTAGTMTVDLENAPKLVKDSTYKIAAAVLPFTQPANKALQLKVYYKASDENIYEQTYDIAGKTDGDRVIERGKYYIVQQEQEQVQLDLSTALTKTTLTDDWFGAGSEADPYQIRTRADLAALVTAVNNGTNQSGKFFRLMNDIDLGGSATPWTRIGDEYSIFAGTFDGAGHSITGLYMTATDDSDGTGLFGCINSYGSVKDLSVSGVIVGSGNCYSVGGIAGQNNGTITNCSFFGSVSGTGSVGGIAGQNYATITNCHNEGSVSGTGNYVGGIAGCNNSSASIANCHNAGSVSGTEYSVGGIAGQNNSTITNCHNEGSVSGSYNVGGIVGAAGSSTNNSIKDCSNTGSVSGTGNVGGIIGDKGYKCTITDCVYLKDCAKIDTTAQRGVGGTTDDTSGQTAAKSLADIMGSTEWSASVNFGGGNGLQSNPYRITRPEELAFLAKKVNDGLSWSRGKFFVLVNDIDLTGKKWTRIGNDDNTDAYRFLGIFDGAGHTIRGLYISAGSDNNGLFGAVGTNGTVKNLAVNGYIDGNGKSYIGGIAGDNFGTIISCSFSGSVSGNIDVGGIVGYNKGTITNCYNVGSVSGGIDVGGIAGRNNSGTIANCYNVGSVSGTSNNVGGMVGSNNYGTIANCYNVGSVKGKTSVGGIAGYNISNSITSCYYLATCVTNGSDYGISLSADQMKGNATGTFSVNSNTYTNFVEALNGWVTLNKATYPDACAWRQTKGLYPTLAY